GVAGTNSKPEALVPRHAFPVLVPPSGGPRIRRWVGTRHGQRVVVHKPRRAKSGVADTMVESRREADVQVFERFTDRARRVVVLAQEEARLLNHNYIG